MKEMNFRINELRVIYKITRKEIKEKAKDFIKDNTNLTEHEIEDYAELMTKFITEEL